MKDWSHCLCILILFLYCCTDSIGGKEGPLNREEAYYNPEEDIEETFPEKLPRLPFWAEVELYDGRLKQVPTRHLSTESKHERLRHGKKKSKPVNRYLSNVEAWKLAKCGLINKTVELPIKETTDWENYPACIKVQRCSGCCPSVVPLQCEPTETRNVTVQVKRKNMVDKNREEYLNVTVVEHLKCGCFCKTKDNDCGPNHKYDEKKCQCVCRNMLSCDTKLQKWNPYKCQCVCKRRHCSESSNKETCRCERNTFF